MALYEIKKRMQKILFPDLETYSKYIFENIRQILVFRCVLICFRRKDLGKILYLE
jgi:hypothetical protein